MTHKKVTVIITSAKKKKKMTLLNLKFGYKSYDVFPGVFPGKLFTESTWLLANIVNVISVYKTSYLNNKLSNIFF